MFVYVRSRNAISNIILYYFNTLWVWGFKWNSKSNATKIQNSRNYVICLKHHICNNGNVFAKLHTMRTRTRTQTQSHHIEVANSDNSIIIGGNINMNTSQRSKATDIQHTKTKAQAQAKVKMCCRFMLISKRCWASYLQPEISASPSLPSTRS